MRVGYVQGHVHCGGRRAAASANSGGGVWGGHGEGLSLWLGPERFLSGRGTADLDWGYRWKKHFEELLSPSYTSSVEEAESLR